MLHLIDDLTSVEALASLLTLSLIVLAFYGGWALGCFDSRENLK